MVIGITGVTGFVGRALASLCRAHGHRVVGYSRDPSKLSGLCDEARPFSPMNVNGCDAVAHLAGENVAGLWTNVKRERIRSSRIDGTSMVVDAIGAARPQSIALVSASAVGWYGDTGENAVDESTPKGRGFLADVCEAWEHQAHRAEDLGSRVTIVRIGVVLGLEGGALKAMLPAFRYGLGARLGSGRQWFSWITIQDLAALFLFALENNSVSGVLNGCAPNPVRNAEYTAAVAGALHRPAFMFVPEGILRGFLGRFADELLENRRVVPARTMSMGFRFSDPEIGPALNRMLGG